MLRKKYKSKSDQDLHKAYCNKNDEVPYYWLHYRYFKFLAVAIRSKVRDRPQAEDIFTEVYIDLKNYEASIRHLKFKLINGKAMVPLRKKVIGKAIDLYRHNKNKFKAGKAVDAATSWELKDSNDFIRQLDASDQIEKIKSILKIEDVKFLEIWLTVNPKDRKGLCELTGKSQKEVDTTIKRIKRQIRRFLNKF